MKSYMRLVRTSETMLQNFRIPSGSIYGRGLYFNTEILYVCQNYDGLSARKLEVWIKKPVEKNWHKVQIYQKHNLFRDIVKAISALGYIPKVTCPTTPVLRKISSRIPGKPYTRKVVYDYMRNGQAVGSLIRQTYDNSGNSVIGNGDSYRAIHKDMLRREVDAQ